VGERKSKRRQLQKLKKNLEKRGQLWKKECENLNWSKKILTNEGEKRCELSERVKEYFLTMDFKESQGEGRGTLKVQKGGRVNCRGQNCCTGPLEREAAWAALEGPPAQEGVGEPNRRPLKTVNNSGALKEACKIFGGGGNYSGFCSAKMKGR